MSVDAAQGRRRLEPDVRRGQILACAVRLFGERPYAEVSTTDIARSAGVARGLINHYFGTKKDLFLAATALPVDPSLIVQGLLAGGTDGLGHRLVGALVGVWDSPTGTPLLAAVRGAFADDARTDALRQFLVTEVLGKVGATLDVPRPEADLRVSLAASQLVGLITARYLLRIPPLAEATAAVVVAAIGPTIQHYLTGDLGIVSERPPPPPER